MKSLNAIFDTPTRSNIRWRTVEKMLLALGAELTEGSGSRVRIKLNDMRLTLHRPHPSPDMDKGAVNTLRSLLERTGHMP